jgi:hypothetical protein
MLVIVDTNHATHIAINVPAEEAEKALPALVNLFERNAAFYNVGYSILEEVEPKITVQLGNKYQVERGGLEIVVQTDEVSSFLTDDFVALTPSIFLNYKKTLEEKEKELSRLRNKVKVLEEDLDNLINKEQEQ